MKWYKRAGSTAVAIILVTYFLSIISTMHDKLDDLRVLTPFRYFDPGTFFNTGHLDGPYVVLSAAIVAVCLAVAYVVYNRRDLYI